jgi:small subunit ribosomal protein S17
MQDEEKQQEQQDQPEQPEAAEGADEAAAAETPEAPEAPEAAAAPAAAPADEDEPLGPKQRRKLARSTFTGPAGPQRSPEQRIAERGEQRSRSARERARWRAKQRERRPAERGPAQTPPEDTASGARKVRQGLVVSAKPDKTITVRIDVVHTHRVYGKVIRNTGTLHAHDETNQANEGDMVRIVECRPLSRTKRWRLLEVLERAR